MYVVSSRSLSAHSLGERRLLHITDPLDDVIFVNSLCLSTRPEEMSPRELFFRDRAME